MRWEDVPAGAPVHRLASDEQYDSLDEAIVAALAELDEGGRLDVHMEDCQSEDGADESCTCVPFVLVKGASA